MLLRVAKGLEGGPERPSWQNYVEDLAWSRLGIPPAELPLVAGDRDAWRSQPELLPRNPKRTSGQHRVSSSKTVRPHAPCGARCMGHAIRTWSAVCSAAPHSRFGEGARLHLCMNEWNRPTPVLKRLSLTQAARDKPIPTGLALVLGTKTRSLEEFSQYFAFHL